MPAKTLHARAKAIHRTDDTHKFKLVLGLSAITIGLLMLWSNPSHAAGKATHVKPGEATRVFVMAGFTPDACAFKGFPDMQLDAQPAKGQVAFKTGEATTIQYSLSGKCIGTQVQGTGIYYTPVAGQTGEDTFTVSGRLGNNEPATRTFSVIIDENGYVQ
jgi:hypothetical protein